MSSEFDIQAAIYSALSGSAELTALGPAIVDFGPTAEDGSTVYPYVTVGDILLGEFDTDDTNGFDVELRVHTWTNTGSAKLAKQIQGAIYGALHKADIEVPGFNLINIYREDSDVMKSSSGAHHGVCEYRALADKT